MRRNWLVLSFVVSYLVGFFGGARILFARTAAPSASPAPSIEATASPVPDITQKTTEAISPLEKILSEQNLGAVWPKNPLKYAIREAVKAGVPANIIVLLILLPAVASIIASARHLIGLRGFGIFLPAALSVAFVAIGPVVGIGLFLLIVSVSLAVRIILRKLKVKLQYLPRMAFIIWAVSFSVLGLLLLTPIIKYPPLTNVSIFPVLFLSLLAEDFTRVQLGKSFKTAFSLTFETLLLAYISYLFLTYEPIREYALVKPELCLLVTLVIDFVLGRYSGLRLLEIIRFKKLLETK